MFLPSFEKCIDSRRECDKYSDAPRDFGNARLEEHIRHESDYLRHLGRLKVLRSFFIRVPRCGILSKPEAISRIATIWER